MSSFRRGISSCTECPVCHRVYNSSDINSSRDHDRLCNPDYRTQRMSELSRIEMEKIQSSQEKLQEESKKTEEMIEALESELMGKRPMSSFGAYSAQILPHMNKRKIDNSMKKPSKAGNKKQRPTNKNDQSNMYTSVLPDDTSAHTNSKFGYSNRTGRGKEASFSDGRIDFTELSPKDIGEMYCNRLAVEGLSSNSEESEESLDENSEEELENVFENANSNNIPDTSDLVNNGWNGSTPVDGNTTRSSMNREETADTCLIRLLNGCQDMRQKYYYNSRQKTYMELSSILSSINAPNHVYNKIVKWATKSKPKDLLSPIAQRTLIKQLALNQGLEHTFPSTNFLSLPSGNAIKVTKFGFASQLLSLLTDERLMRPENLVNNGNLLEKRFPQEYVDDVDTGKWFLQTQDARCKRHNDILVPIIVFIDKTHVTASNNVEAISITLGKVSAIARLYSLFSFVISMNKSY